MGIGLQVHRLYCCFKQMIPERQKHMTNKSKQLIEVQKVKTIAAPARTIKYLYGDLTTSSPTIT